MSANVTEKESRRVQRYSLSLPTRIEVRVDRNVSWSEVARLEDVSAFGAAFILKRPIKRGRMLVMSVPLPRQLRCYDFLEPQYRIWSLVRRCLPIQSSNGEAKYAIGVAFVGKNPPRSHIEDPSKLYNLAQREEGGLWQLVEVDTQKDDRDLPPDQRRQTRFTIPETLLVELLDENGDVVASEVSVSENISLGGASVFTSLDVADGTFLKVTSERHNVSIISIVRGNHVGPDSIRRLHLEFIDHMFPLDGIQ